MSPFWVSWPCSPLHCFPWHSCRLVSMWYDRKSSSSYATGGLGFQVSMDGIALKVSSFPLPCVCLLLTTKCWLKKEKSKCPGVVFTFLCCPAGVAPFKAQPPCAHVTTRLGSHQQSSVAHHAIFGEDKSLQPHLSGALHAHCVLAAGDVVVKVP